MTDPTDQIARQIYWGILDQGMPSDFDCAFDELPHDYRQQLRSIAQKITLPDPYEKLDAFAARSKDIGHYVVAPLIDSFKQYEINPNGV